MCSASEGPGTPGPEADPPGPESADPPPLGGRLHPTAILTWAAQQGVGLVVLLFLGGTGRWGWLFPVVGVLVVVTSAVIRHRRFTWRLDSGGLVIEQGLLQRSRRVIPIERIQAVDLVRPVRHRILRVVQVRIEAIGGSDSEGVLEALDEATAGALQAALTGERRAAAAPGAAPRAAPRAPALDASDSDPDGIPRAPTGPTVTGRVIARVRPADLVKAGLTGGRVGVLAVLVGGAQQIAGDRVDEAVALVPTDLGIVALAALVVVGAVVVFALSILATVVSYWGFTLAVAGPDLRLTRGLLEQRSQTIPLRRIQSLRVEQNVLRRVLGLAAVKADLAGRAGAAAAESGLLLPIAPVGVAQDLVSDLLAMVATPQDLVGTDPVRAALTPAPARSRRRWVIRGVAAALPAAVLGVVAIPVLGWPSWTPAVMALVGAAGGVPLMLAAWRALGWASVGGVLVAQTGVLVRRRVHVPIARIQTMAVQASPFQRRRDLADVIVGIARSGGWAGPRLLELDATAAADLTADTVHEAVQRSRRSAHRPPAAGPVPPPPPLLNPTD